MKPVVHSFNLKKICAAFDRGDFIKNSMTILFIASNRLAKFNVS